MTNRTHTSRTLFPSSHDMRDPPIIFLLRIFPLRDCRSAAARSLLAPPAISSPAATLDPPFVFLLQHKPISCRLLFTFPWIHIDFAWHLVDSQKKTGGAACHGEFVRRAPQRDLAARPHGEHGRASARAWRSNRLVCLGLRAAR